MLYEIFIELDEWVKTTNSEFSKEGTRTITPFFIKVLGQNALLEAGLDLDLAVTMDIDVYANYEYLVRKKFEDLLAQQGKILDPLSAEIWMPKETEYIPYYDGVYLKAFLAKAEYVLLSKALKAPNKNKSLLLQYLAQGASPLFKKLRAKYKLNLENFL